MAELNKRSIFLNEKAVFYSFNSSRGVLRRQGNTLFWWSLGVADQMAHHLTHYLIIWLLLDK
jgi:hypothetical protein